MALQSAVYKNVNAYLYNSDRTLKESLGTFTYIFPWYDQNATYPTGDLTIGGTPTDLLITLGNLISNFQTISAIKWLNASEMFSPDYLSPIFPNIKVVLKNSGDFLVLENPDNNKICATYGTSNAYYYDSLSDFITDTNRTGSYRTEIFRIEPSAGSGATRGNTRVALYTDLDSETGNISGFKLLTINGVRSTTGKLAVSAWENPSSDYYEPFFAFLGKVDFIPVHAEDPYAGAGDSEPENFPLGNFNYNSNHIGDADHFRMPIVSAVDTGFVTLYNPSILELKQLSNYLWSSAFDLNTFKKIFNDPMDLFIGLSIVPVEVPDGPSKEVGIGLIPSGVYMTTAASQWVKVDCGVCEVPNFSGGYLDYSPYTKVEIYLPYIGFRTLNADELSGKEIHCTYMIDILSGSCTCWLDVLMPLDESIQYDKDYNTTYVFMGECATSIPLASGDWTNLINGIIGVAASVGTGFATGGAGGAIAGGVSAASSVAVNDSKINVERSGAITSAGGLLAPQQPYLIISTPRIHKPADTPYYTGYPAYFTASLGNMSGYTEVAEIRLSNLSATVEEKSEIEMLLKGGVIL